MAEVELTTLLRDVANSYSQKELEDVLSFTKKTLQGEFLKLQPGKELEDAFKKMKTQGQVSSSNIDLLKYYVQSAPVKNRKNLTDKLNSLKLHSDKNEFVGRDNDVDALQSKESGSKIVNIHGDQGVGKTTLAHEFAKRQALAPSQIFSADLQHAKDTLTMIKTILLAFHSPKILTPCEEVLFEIVENLEKPAILILDNVVMNVATESHEEEGVKFVSLLERIVMHDKEKNLTILLTSRSKIQESFVENYHLEALSIDNSAELLKEACANQASVDKISRLCQNKPLCLQTIRAIMKEKLVNPDEILAAVAEIDIHDDNSKNILIEAFRSFSPDMKEVSIQLSLFQSPFTVKLAASLLQCTTDEAQFYLSVLKNRHFLTLRKSKYSMHSLAKSILTEKGDESEYLPCYTQAQENFSKVFLRRAKVMASLLDKDYVKMYGQLQHDKHNINLALKISFEKGFILTSSDFSENFHVSLVAECLQSEQERAKFFKDWSAVAFSKGELLTYVHISCQLLLVLLKRTATKPEARNLLAEIKEALIEAEEAHSRNIFYLLAESSYQFAQGEIAFADFMCNMCSKQEFDVGVESLKKCLQIRKELLGNHTETARCLNAIGNCYMKLEEHQNALDAYTQALDMRKQLSGSREHFDSPAYMNNIACVHEEMGKTFLNQCRQGRDPRQQETLYMKSREEFHQAISNYQEAINMEKRLFIYGFSNTATFYRNMSNGYSYLEEYQQAFVFAKKALAMRKKILGIDANTLRSYYQVGVAYERLGNIDKAKKYYYKAYNMELALPLGEQSEIKPKVLRKINSLLGDVDEAIQFGSRTDEEALTSDDEKEEEIPADDKLSYSDDSSSDSEFWEKESTKSPKRPFLPMMSVQTSGLAISPSKLSETLETEPEFIEKCNDIHESHTIGVEGSNRSINNTGIFICFEPNTVPSKTVVSSHVYCECQHPLDTTETLVSRVVSLEVVPEKLNNKSFTMVIPHSVVHCLWWLYRECYETVVKEFCQDSNSWRDVESHTYNSVWDQEGLKKKDLKNVKFPSISLTRQSGGTVCVVSRLRTVTKSIVSSRCTLKFPIFPPLAYPLVSVILQENTFSSIVQVSLKVIPVDHRLMFSYPIVYGPIIILSVDSKHSNKILKPVTVIIHDPLFLSFFEHKQLRVLYKKDNGSDGEWIDVTDTVPVTFTNDMELVMQVNHFSMFWPIYCKDLSDQTLVAAKKIFSRVFGSAPVNAFFDVAEKPNSRVGKKTILNVKVMPWHLAPDLQSNSDESIYDKEDIRVDLDENGGVTRYRFPSKDLEIPFTFKFDSQHTKSKGMHVDLHGNSGYIRSNCFFESMMTRGRLGECPFTMSMEIEKVPPGDFFGIPLEENSKSYQTLLQTPTDVLPHCKATEDKNFKKITNKTMSKGDTVDTFESFYQEIAHQDFEEEAFGRLVSALSEFPGAKHVKELLEKGRSIVNQPVDEQTIESISINVQEDYDAFALALNLEMECQEIKTRFRSSKDRFETLVHAWQVRDKERATLHVLMKTLLKISCKDGVNDLIRRYEDMLEGSQAHDSRETAVVAAPPNVHTMSEPRLATSEGILSPEVTGNTESEEMLVAQQGQVCSSSEGRQESSANTAHEPSVKKPDNDGRDRLNGLSRVYLVICLLVLAVAILIYRYIG